MTRVVVCWLWISCIAGPAFAGQRIDLPPTPRPLAEQLRDASRAKEYRPVDPRRLRLAEELFAALFAGRSITREMQSGFRALGLVVESALVGTERCWVVREPEDERYGGGVYVVRPDAKYAVMLQAPHSFHDKHTREITLSLFSQSRFAAAAWNTINRRRADFAHRQDHFLNAFTRAFIRQQPNGLVVQLHGFSRSKRKSQSAQHANVIVSSGATQPGRHAWLIRSALREGNDFGEVKLFPSDVGELGATTNYQAKLLRQLGSDAFLHLELDRNLRDRLRQDATLQFELLKKVETVFRTSK